MIRMYYLASPLGIHRSIIGNDSKQARIHNERYPTHQSIQWSNMMQKYVFPSTYNFQFVHKPVTFSHFCKSLINVKALKIESVPKLSSHWIGVPLQNAILLQSGFIYWTQQKSEAELKPVKSSLGSLASHIQIWIFSRISLWILHFCLRRCKYKAKKHI